MLTTRDASLPPAYSETLEALSVGPLWTALHVLLPNERVSSAVPHRWRWRDLGPLLLEAARLVAGRVHRGRPCAAAVALRGHRVSPGTLAVGHRPPRPGQHGGCGAGGPARGALLREPQDRRAAAPDHGVRVPVASPGRGAARR